MNEEIQNHEINILYPGTFADLMDYLNKNNIKIEFFPPGLVGSKGVLKILTENEND